MRKILFDSIHKIDFIVWGITLLFFIVSAFLKGGNINESFSGASGIIVLMFFVGFSIELILSALNNVKGLGKITGFITNGPEALVLIVGLINGNILFAASTPLGSNLVNPILLFIALFISGYYIKFKSFKYNVFFSLSFILTALLAILFYKITSQYYFYWILLSTTLCILLYVQNFTHDEKLEIQNEEGGKKIYLLYGIIILLISGYFLDPIVSFTAQASKAPKGLIGFLVLATLTSWPEFKSVLALLKRKKMLDAFINIFISNITNLTLAIIGIIVWFFVK